MMITGLQCGVVSWRHRELLSDKQKVSKTQKTLPQREAIKQKADTCFVISSLSSAMFGRRINLSRTKRSNIANQICFRIRMDTKVFERDQALIVFYVYRRL